MYQELEDDIGCRRQSPHLQDWAREGVLLFKYGLNGKTRRSAFS